MIKWIWLLACLMSLILISAAEEDMSSAQLVQFAVDKMGDSNQDALVSGFHTAESNQIGYSSDGNVTQTISYDNIGNGSIMQWGESGDMPREERTLSLDRIGDSGFTWQWSKGDVNQTINVRNSENLYLKQIMGGLRKILFPDPAPRAEQSNNWWFCGKAENGIGGLPLCAEKVAGKIFDGTATPRDYYIMQILEEDYDVFPSEKFMPHIILTKWNITKVNGSFILKFRAHNFGKKIYNATLMFDMVSDIKIVNLDGNTGKGDWDIKMPDKQAIEIGKYTIPSMKDLEREVVIPLNDTKIKNLQMRMISD